MDQDLKHDLDENFARMDERFEAVDRRFEETDKRIEKVETSLVGAFYGWARPMEIRVNGMVNTVMGFEDGSLWPSSASPSWNGKRHLDRPRP
jgi:hypothetical protein